MKSFTCLDVRVVGIEFLNSFLGKFLSASLHSMRNCSTEDTDMGDLCTIMASSTTKFLTPGANPSSLPSTLIAGFETTASPGAPAIIVPESITKKQ
ncbi:hypothetical protein CVS40_9233 [Lucilia cuprina]|nr:hypothetical protein CVS40_9233 [Lucilia cuprina]